MVGPIAIAFHAEKLHDDRVWKHMYRFASRLTKSDIIATFFIYPFRAQVAGIDITSRVQTVAALGHEIAQHTHFYAGTRIDSGEKVDDLSENNIVQCLSRDFTTLERIGVRPRGFSAGGWLVNRTVCDTLINLGFGYDCSAQFPKPKKLVNSANNFWLRSPGYYSNSRGQILCLPTTCSLGEWFKWGWRVRTEGRLPYQLVYLHDYDLLSLRHRLMLSCLLKMSGRSTKPLANIAGEFRFEEVI